jgi:multicomponent Na+:H+ antiporter subunit G
MEYLQIAGAVVVLMGSLVQLIASIGLLRMPDSYLRVQVGTKASTAGIALIMLGLAMITPHWFGKLFTILIFVMMTNPVSSNLLMRAAHRTGHPMSSKTIMDQLTEDEKTLQDNGNL